MSWAAIGAAVGGAFALVNFFILQAVAQKIEMDSNTVGKNRGATVLRWAAWADLIIFPLIGYYIGPLLAA